MGFPSFMNPPFLALKKIYHGFLVAVRKSFFFQVHASCLLLDLICYLLSYKFLRCVVYLI